MAGSGSSEVRTPIFSGENYEFRKIKMVTIFKSYGLWNLVEKGIPVSYSKKKKKKATKEISKEKDDEKAAAILMKDAKALDSAKAAWELLYGEFHGGDHVRSVKLQNLICEFEYTRMHDNESLSTYLTRLNDLINQMKTYGEVLSNERLVQKVLISLSKVYDPICLVIENTKSLETLELQEVIAIMKSQEQQFELHNANAIEKPSASFTVSSKGHNKNASNSSSSKAQKNWNPKGKPWESKGKLQWNNYAQTHSSSTGQEAVKSQCKVCSKHQFGECRHKGKPKCNNCDRFGHLARECTAEKVVHKANYANQMEVTNVAGKVRMPTGALVNMAGMGSLVIDTTKGRKYIREVMYLPGLKENLLSVGQMDEHGYFLVFGDGMCKVFDSSLMNYLIIKVPMMKNRCYPLSLLVENQLVMKASITQCTWTWHKRLGHLHFIGLKQLRDKDMVYGLPQLEELSGVCEGCQFGKQHRLSFPEG
ncbi:unnamed protein product [Prunus brigantina]